MKIICMIANKNNYTKTYNAAEIMTRLGYKKLDTFIVDNGSILDRQFNGVEYKVVDEKDTEKLKSVALKTSEGAIEMFIEPAMFSRYYIAIGEDTTLRKLRAVYGDKVFGVELVKKYEKKTSSEDVIEIKYGDNTEASEIAATLLKIGR